MDNMNKTIVPTSLNNTNGSNYGNWSILIILFVFLGIFIICILYKVFFSTFQKEVLNKTESKNIPATQPIPKPSSSPTEIFQTTSNISDENIIVKDENLNNALESKNQSNTSPIADDSYSNIQRSKPTHKSGWCYIGEERGFRSCIEVGDNDLCMSGNIFPSQEICINPTLR
jgi:hypothetical protein